MSQTALEAPVQPAVMPSTLFPHPLLGPTAAMCPGGCPSPTSVAMGSGQSTRVADQQLGSVGDGQPSGQEAEMGAKAAGAGRGEGQRPEAT